MRSIVIPLIIACLAPAAASAQDLGMVEGLFEEVSAVTVFYQRGWVPSSDEIRSGDNLHGGGTEVLINLKSTERASYELGLGASYLRGYQAVEPTLELHTALRALPTISLYASWNRLLGPLTVYGGASFGLVELWNAQAYDTAGTQWDVEARAFEQGVSLGTYLEDSPMAGLFVEGGYRFRNFHSVRWTAEDEDLSEDWPRSLDFSGPFLSLGWQLQLDGDEDNAQDDITPPAPAGVWMLERVDGAPLPTLLDSVQGGQNEAVHGVLRLWPDEDANEGEPDGVWTVEMNVRPVAGTAGRRVLHQEAGEYTLEDNVLTLTAKDGRTYRLERLSGRLYLQWRGQVLTFAPGNAAPNEE